MVNFDHRTSGSPEEAWLGSGRWRDVPALVLTDLRRLIVVAAHPDDESLGAGGLIARAAASGVPVVVVVATNGDASHPQSPTMTRAALAAVRRAELVQAVEIIAPGAAVDFLDLPDGELRAHERRLSAHLESLQPAHGTLLVAPWRRDGHGDHEVAGAVTARVAQASGAQLLEYPIWMWHWSNPDDATVPWTQFVTLTLDAAEQQGKARAIACHLSQNAALSEADGDEALLDDGFHDYFRRPFEVFVTPAGSPTLGREFFDEFYEGKDDPWGFETRWYEIRKRAITIATLPRRTFTSALEVGCSIGVLTEQLASRCDALIATDIVERPLERARTRLAGQPNVRFQRSETPRQWPAGSFDLIVLSEVAYYWSEADLDRAIQHVRDSLTPDGVLVACHWRHPVDGYPRRGDDVHSALVSMEGFEVIASHREHDFLLDVFARSPARSVAQETGLV